MKIKSIFSHTVISSLFVFSAHTHAGEDEHNHGSHDAHVHGEAIIRLASDNDRLTFQFESPAMNIVGYEHEPKTKEQHKILEMTLKKLNKPEALIAFNGGQCSFAGVDIDNPFKTGSEHDKHKHELDEHKHEHEEQDASEHREFVVEYQTHCKKIAELKTIDFSLLKEFKGIETLELQYIISGQQGALNLTGSSSILTLPN